MLQSMGSQRVKYNLLTEEQQQNSDVEVITPDVLIFGDSLSETVRLRVEHEGLGPHDRSSALYEEEETRDPCLSLCLGRDI